MYIITDYEKLEEGGYRAFLPGCQPIGFGGLSHASPGNFAFELCHVLPIGPAKIVPPMERVPRELERLLDAGEMYPPAIAIARDAVSFRDKALSRAEFATLLGEQLRVLLDEQPRSPYFLARAVATDNMYKAVSSYYWIVGWRILFGRIVALWVSHGYIVYDDPLTDFDVTEAFMTERFGAPRPEPVRKPRPTVPE